jgi:hypothetical protein
MANEDRPTGLSPTGTIGGTPYSAKVRRYAVPATDGTALYVGDAVVSTGSANADGVPYVIQAAAANILRGVVVGFEPDPTNLELKYRLASTERIAMVCDDPMAEFEIQENGAIAVTAVGGNAELVVAAGSATSGLSGMELASSSAITGAAQLRIIQLVQRPNNEVGTNGKWVVKINEHELLTAAGV